MGKSMFAVGFALVFLGFAVFMHDITTRKFLAWTSIGDAIDTVEYFYEYRITYGQSDFTQTIMLLPFSYASMSIGLVIALVSAFYHDKGR